jgi:Cu/Ag efflux pump CusA
MLNKIIQWSISNKLIVGILTLGLVVWGVFSLQSLPIDAVPDITNNEVQNTKVWLQWEQIVKGRVCCLLIGIVV